MTGTIEKEKKMMKKLLADHQSLETRVKTFQQCADENADKVRKLRAAIKKLKDEVKEAEEGIKAEEDAKNEYLSNLGDASNKIIELKKHIKKIGELIDAKYELEAELMRQKLICGAKDGHCEICEIRESCLHFRYGTMRRDVSELKVIKKALAKSLTHAEAREIIEKKGKTLAEEYISEFLIDFFDRKGVDLEEKG